MKKWVMDKRYKTEEVVEKADIDVLREKYSVENDIVKELNKYVNTEDEFDFHTEWNEEKHIFSLDWYNGNKLIATEYTEESDECEFVVQVALREGALKCKK